MQTISRKDAVRLIEKVAEEVAEELLKAEEEKRKPAGWALTMKMEFSRYHIDLPKKCSGEAHSNAFIDNCGVCMPRWGWVFTDKGYRIP